MHVINIGHDILEANSRLANKNRNLLNANNIFALNIMGAIGSGKTTLIEEAIKQLKDCFEIAVIAGDIVAEIDAARFEKLDVKVVPVNTGRECHLDAKLIEKSLEQIDLKNTDLLFIENVGNLICPVDYMLGKHVRVVIVSVSEGDDIVQKHPMIFRNSNLALINKTDIAEAVSSSLLKMKEDVHKINPGIPVVLTSSRDMQSIHQWIEYIKSGLDAK
ncbi:hydrogenase nickel incorporation protein HypB [Methanosalsum zhilinae]|nr:hydrogenase nickel incorporation protein HypB [Methanosalsum zhilinae]